MFDTFFFSDLQGHSKFELSQSHQFLVVFAHSRRCQHTSHADQSPSPQATRRSLERQPALRSTRSRLDVRHSSNNYKRKSVGGRSRRASACRRFQKRPMAQSSRLARLWNHNSRQTLVN